MRSKIEIMISVDPVDQAYFLLFYMKMFKSKVLQANQKRKANNSK